VSAGCVGPSLPSTCAAVRPGPSTINHERESLGQPGLLSAPSWPKSPARPRRTLLMFPGRPRSILTPPPSTILPSSSAVPLVALPFPVSESTLGRASYPGRLVAAWLSGPGRRNGDDRGSSGATCSPGPGPPSAPDCGPGDFGAGKGRSRLHGGDRMSGAVPTPRVVVRAAEMSDAVPAAPRPGGLGAARDASGGERAWSAGNPRTHGFVATRLGPTSPCARDAAGADGPGAGGRVVDSAAPRSPPPTTPTTPGRSRLAAASTARPAAPRSPPPSRGAVSPSRG
jgi:hypothetical protein